MKKVVIIYILVIGCISICTSVFAQTNGSIHQVQNTVAGKTGNDYSEFQWDSINQFVPLKSKTAKEICNRNKVVFGWHPYWNGTSYNEYDFSLLSDVAYFSYEVDPATGGYSTIHSWKTSPLIGLAKAAGTRVSLAVTLFSGHRTFFENPKSRQTLIDSLISLVKERGAHGVNIDFEAVPSSQRDNLTSFIKDIGNQLHQKIPGSLVSIAIPAVNWNNTFDVKAMEPYIDLFLIMGYDYYYSGGPKAGPVSPKNNGKLWAAYDVTRSVRNYLNVGIPGAKLCLGVPYYGYDWQTADSTFGSASMVKGTARLYKDAVTEASFYGRKWDRNASVPYFMYKSGSNWRQCWYDDAVSLGLKYDMVNMYNIAGIGIWALGYDRSRTELWGLLKDKFTSCGNTSCSGLFTDMGGPEGNYFTTDKYSFSIEQKDAKKLSVVFYELNLAEGDSLIFYEDKNSIGAPLAFFTNTQSPGIINTNGNILSVKFVSTNATSSAGWQARWSCGESLPPTALKLSNKTISENLPKGSLAGRFTINGNLIGKKCILVVDDSLDNGDNTTFRISGDSLLLASVLNFENKNKYFITVRGTDSLQRNIYSSFFIEVEDRNDVENPPWGIDSLSSGVVIFPNPTRGKVYLIVNEVLGQQLYHYVDVLDCTGRKIGRYPLHTDGLNRRTLELDLSFLPKGLYFIKMRVGDKLYGRKVVVLHK